MCSLIDYFKLLISISVIVSSFPPCELNSEPCKNVWGELTGKEVLALLNSSIHYLKETLRLEEEFDTVRDADSLIKPFEKVVDELRDRYDEVIKQVKAFRREASDMEYEALLVDIDTQRNELGQLVEELMLKDKAAITKQVFKRQEDWKAQLSPYKVLKRQHKENRQKLNSIGIKLWSQEEPYDGGKYDLTVGSDGTLASVESLHALYQTLDNLCQGKVGQEEGQHIEEVMSQISAKLKSEEEVEALAEFQNTVEAYQRSMSYSWKQFEDYELEGILYGLKLNDIDLGWSDHMLQNALDALKYARIDKKRASDKLEEETILVLEKDEL